MQMACPEQADEICHFVLVMSLKQANPKQKGEVEFY